MSGTCTIILNVNTYVAFCRVPQQSPVMLNQKARDPPHGQHNGSTDARQATRAQDEDSVGPEPTRSAIWKDATESVHIFPASSPVQQRPTDGSGSPVADVNMSPQASRSARDVKVSQRSTTFVSLKSLRAAVVKGKQIPRANPAEMHLPRHR
ncbi:hypothetical protein FOMPIDRAFT_155225 [Fomitopsis schrenkii]|uniref:Uncharacterized protein n=1 Tax=Fomitopsis schrenkii TaxID=2126942 RepID=S8EKV1_FOMSC|nr:hypothetical protein FOMPIDRAFT_155225 [Fomitopsis schrenkii]